MRRIAWMLAPVLAFALGWAAPAAATPDKVSVPSRHAGLNLDAYWFRAAVDGPRPVVISLHGCNGALDARGRLNSVWGRDAGYFNDEKMDLFVLDSFTPRGEASICETPPARRKVDEVDRRDDVYDAIRWLVRQPGVDAARIAVVGRSHGGGTVLGVMDRTDKVVQAEPVRPRAAIALYPGCGRFLRMWNYEAAAPLLILAGELDDWTPSADCVTLVDRVRRAQQDVPVEIVVYPNSHHAFDSAGPVQVRDNVGGTRSGKATVGGNPEARRDAHRRTFEFLAQQFGMPLRLSLAERFDGHRYRVPDATGFARLDDAGAVPVSDAGRARYRVWLGLAAPKAFAVTEKGGWYLTAGDRDAMRAALDYCDQARVRCWLYAVDDRVVWQADAAARIDAGHLQARP